MVQVRGSDVGDVEEAARYVETFGITRERVFLMPMSQSAEEHAEVLRGVWDTAVKLGLKVTPRPHIVAWGNERGK